MTHRSLFKRFRRDEKGATAVEFAVVSGVFFIMLMGIMEYGLYMMTAVAIESAVTQAGRASAILPGTAPDRATAVENYIRQKTAGLMNANSITISAARVSDGGTVAPDLCFINGINNTPTSPANCPVGTTYIETNGIAGYQGNGGTTVGLAGDLVEIRVNYPWRVFFPIFNSMFGNNNGVVLITSTTVIRNEPF